MNTKNKKGLYLNGIVSGIKTKKQGKTDALFEFLDKIEEKKLSYGGTSLTEVVEGESTLQLEGVILPDEERDFVIEDFKNILKDNEYKYEGQVIPVESLLGENEDIEENE